MVKIDSRLITNLSLAYNSQNVTTIVTNISISYLFSQIGQLAFATDMLVWLMEIHSPVYIGNPIF